MKRRFVFLVSIVIFVLVLALGAVYFLRPKVFTKTFSPNPTLLNNPQVLLSTDIKGKKLVFIDENIFYSFLNKIDFWKKEKILIEPSGKTLDVNKTVTLNKLEIFVTINGTGKNDRSISSSGGVLTSFGYYNEQNGSAYLTIYLDESVLESSESVNQKITYAIMRAIYIINKNAPVTLEDFSALNNLLEIYLPTEDSTVIGLENKLSLFNFKLIKTAKAASCVGGTVSCGYMQYWKTCGGDRNAKACFTHYECSDGLACLSGSECVVEDTGSCSSLDQSMCSAGFVCNPLGCVASGSCYLYSATPPPPSTDPSCHYVSDNGCYTGNCPDDLAGHGRGSCAVGQYWCTGGHMEGNCNTCVPNWGNCSVSCGGGVMTDGCGGSLPCNTQSCCTPSWGACSALCGGGVELDGCGGSRACNTQACRWWQTKDGDVTTNGDLTSVIPSGQYFSLAGAGGYSGVPVYGGSTSLTSSDVSTDGWLANSAYSSAKLYNSVYFINSVPSEVTVNEVSSSSVDGSFFESGGTQSFGYYWYIYDATSTGLDLTISSASNLGSRKVILIVKGANLNLGGNINLTDGEGFFLGVTSGNMVVSPVATSLEGIYVSDGAFSTGTSGIGTDSQLLVRGTVAGFGGISLQRDLAVNTTSAELFEYAPDQDLLFPAKLGARPSNWREVAP